MAKIRVALPNKKYNVLTGSSIIGNLYNYIDKYGLNKNLFFVIDKNVNGIYADLLTELFAKYPGKISKIVLEASEQKKNLKTVSLIYSALAENNFGRDTLIIGIGGGITGDISGFAASTYMRGIQYLQIPTTLLAAVDSSVGGKTGVNFNKSKNMIGAFYQPELVLIDYNFFSSLPKREINCGVGEILKYAYIASKEFSSYFTENLNNLFLLDEKVVSAVISESILFKSSVVEKDERETGLRKILNFGHTFAHAIETERKHKVKHGEAVLAGIACALFLSKKLKLIELDNLEELLNIIEPLKERIKIEKINSIEVFNLMNADKKNRDGKIKLVLIKDIGKILIDVEADQKDIVDSIEEGVKFFER